MVWIIQFEFRSVEVIFNSSLGTSCVEGFVGLRSRFQTPSMFLSFVVPPPAENSTSYHNIK